MSAEVEKLLASEWRRWSDSPPQLIRPLSGGLTNRSFLLQAGGDKLVLRLNTSNFRALDLDRSAEAAALRRADARHLCAPLVYIDPDRRYLLTRFIHGAKLELHQPRALAQIAQLLRLIHQLPPISAQLNIAHKADHYWQSIDQAAPFFQPLSKLHDLMQSLLQQHNDNPRAYCLCHNDLLPDNLILDASGQLRALDWEYAAVGDPFFDLATVAQGYQLDRRQQQALLMAYLQRPASDTDMNRLAYWQRVYRYLSALWYAVQASRSASLSGVTETLSTEITDLLAAFE